MIIVYDFRISDGLCASQCRSQFLIWPPNFASVTVGSEPSDAGVNVPIPSGTRNNELPLTHYEDPAYPLVARQARVQGVVIVQVQLDKRGHVISAQAISGPAMFIYLSVENAKQWRFASGKPITTVIVYDFELDSGLAECYGNCAASVSVRGPNFVSIIRAPVVLETVDSHSR
jgi:TonB family protein